MYRSSVRPSRSAPDHAPSLVWSILVPSGVKNINIQTTVRCTAVCLILVHRDTKALRVLGDGASFAADPQRIFFVGHITMLQVVPSNCSVKFLRAPLTVPFLSFLMARRFWAEARHTRQPCGINLCDHTYSKVPHITVGLIPNIQRLKMGDVLKHPANIVGAKLQLCTGVTVVLHHFYKFSSFVGYPSQSQNLLPTELALARSLCNIALMYTLCNRHTAVLSIISPVGISSYSRRAYSKGTCGNGSWRQDRQRRG